MENEPPPSTPAEPPIQQPPGGEPSRRGGCGWALLVAAFMILAGIAFLLGMLAMRMRETAEVRTINTATVIRQIEGLSELVTVKYVMEKVVILEDPRWYGESRILLLAHGIVKAGIDLEELEEDDIQIDGKKITMVLPMERITDAYLDERRTQVIEHTTGLIRQFDKGLESNARRMAVADIRSAARYSGILEEARERAELQLENLFLQLGFEEVEFKRPAPVDAPRAPAGE